MRHWLNGIYWEQCSACEMKDPANELHFSFTEGCLQQQSVWRYDVPPNHPERVENVLIGNWTTNRGPRHEVLLVLRIDMANPSHLYELPYRREVSKLDMLFGCQANDAISNSIVMSFHLTMPSNLFLNHLTVASLVTLCCLPTLDLHRRLLATRAPGRVLEYD